MCSRTNVISIRRLLSLCVSAATVLHNGYTKQKQQWGKFTIVNSNSKMGENKKENNNNLVSYFFSPSIYLSLLVF